MRYNEQTYFLRDLRNAILSIFQHHTNGMTVAITLPVLKLKTRGLEELPYDGDIIATLKFGILKGFPSIYLLGVIFEGESLS